MLLAEAVEAAAASKRDHTQTQDMTLGRYIHTLAVTVASTETNLRQYGHIVSAFGVASR